MNKVFKVNDYDWYAAESVQQARDQAVADCGDEEAVYPVDEIVELTAEQMLKFRFREDPSDPESIECSFREQLDTLIAEGREFPDLFASTEF